jgi:hypothetical protein
MQSGSDSYPNSPHRGIPGIDGPCRCVSFLEGFGCGLQWKFPLTPMIKLPKFAALQTWVMRMLRPTTKLGRITLWFGALSALSLAVHWITGSASGSMLSGWTAFLTSVFALCAFSLAFPWARRTLHPSTKLGRTTLWLGGFSVLFLALREPACSASGAKPSSWPTFVTVVFAFCALLLACRWTWRHLMWRLRHRLIVSYIFIGVILSCCCC